MGNTSFNSGGQFAWDSTSLKLLAECPRKYQYKIVEGWNGKTSSVHLLFGGLYASALEGFHKRRASGVPYDDALADTIHAAMIASWDSEAGVPLEFDDTAKTRFNLIRTIVWYLEEFRDDNLATYITADGKAAVEFSFSLPVDEGLVFAGHIDRLAVMGDDIMVTDNKTTKSALGPHYFKTYDTDIQMSMYTFAGKIIYNIPIAGVVIDAVQVAVNFSRFSRGFTFRDPDNLAEWYDETIVAALAGRKMFTENYFPMNRTACGNYGGCQFLNVCSKPRKVRPAFLAGDFTKTDGWDPLIRR